MKVYSNRFYASVVTGVVLALALGASMARAGSPFIDSFSNVDVLASTVPDNGDVNPYGVFVVPQSVGSLVQGDILVSNFNNSGNLQGTGTTIVQVAPNGTATQFAQLDSTALASTFPGGIGLTTALVVLKSGWVIVGNLPTTDGTSATASRGGLIVLDSNGNVTESFVGGPINGPWDMTVLDRGRTASLFVTNVLNGTVAASPNPVNRGTVLRIDLVIPPSRPPRMVKETVIGSGFSERTDPGALVIGPTGVGLASNGTLYVADTLANRIAAIPNAVRRESSAGIGQDVSIGGALNGPLGLAIAPNGDILTVNSGDGNIVEVSPDGEQVATKLLEPLGAGTLFGLAVVPDGSGVYFVDDGTNTLNILH